MDTVRRKNLVSKSEEIYALKIRTQLKRGDQKKIAKGAGCSVELVKKVLGGIRNHRTGKGREIIELAKIIIQARALGV